MAALLSAGAEVVIGPLDQRPDWLVTPVREGPGPAAFGGYAVNLSGAMPPRGSGLVEVLEAMSRAALKAGRRGPPNLAVLDLGDRRLLQFVGSRAAAELDAWRLLERGFSSEAAYGSVGIQGLATSILVDDDFMTRATRGVGSEEANRAARLTLRTIAAAARTSGYPGLHFRGALNRWNFCPSGGEVHATRALGGMAFLDGTVAPGDAIDLSSFWRPAPEAAALDARSVAAAVDRLVRRLELRVNRAASRSRSPARCRAYRPVLLSIENLAATLMSLGLPYDSEAGRAVAAAAVALVTGQAYLTSAGIAATLGPFERFQDDASHILDVLQRQEDHVGRIAWSLVPGSLASLVRAVWRKVLGRVKRHGLRHAHLTALVPEPVNSVAREAGRRAGAEPLASLLVPTRTGGIVAHPAVRKSLRSLGYNQQKIERALSRLEETGGLGGSAGLDAGHLRVFDSVHQAKSAAQEGQMRMLGTLQPLVSGGVSNVFNLVPGSSLQDVEQLLISAWRAGLKSAFVFCGRLISPQPRTRRKHRSSGRGTGPKGSA